MYVTVPCCDVEKVDCGSVKKRKGMMWTRCAAETLRRGQRLHTEMEWEENT